MTELKTEYEATFSNVDKDEIREKLKKVGAVLIKPEFLQKRKNFFLPNKILGGIGFVRVREESDRITMTVKIFNDGDGIERQKESEVIINDFKEGVKILETLGCELKNFQESKREIWEISGVEIMIDEWPFLEPFIEIEGKNEKKVKEISELLGFEWKKAIFDSVDLQYNQKYNISRKQVNEETPKIIFDMDNPFDN